MWSVIVEKCCIYLLLTSVLMACVSVPDKSTLDEQKQLSTKVYVDEADKRAQESVAQHRALNQRALQSLAKLARQALFDDRLSTPADDNALEYYALMESIESGNAEVDWGRRQITERYRELIRQAVASNNIARARVLLNRVQSIGLDDGSFPALSSLSTDRQRIDEKQSESIFVLPDAAIRAREEDIVEKLGEIAAVAKRHDSRIDIIARNDQDGRWIYQTMRDSLRDYRLRGNITVGRAAKVVLLDWDASLANE